MLLDMLFALDPKARVFAIDTHHLFPETYAVWREVEQPLRHDGRGLRGPVAGASSRRRTASGSGRRKPDLSCSIAQGRAARPRRSATSTAGSPASAATSRRRARTRRSSAGTSSTSSGRRTRSPTGATSAAGTTSASASCPYNALARPRLRLDRRHALDAAGRRPRGSLGRDGQGRVRHPYGGRRRTSHRRRRRVVSGFVVWFTGLSAAGKSTIADARRAPSSRRAASSSTGSTATSCATHLSQGPRLLEGGPRHEHRPHRLGRLAARPRRRRRRRLGDLAVRGGAPARPRARRGARDVRRGLRRDVARGVRAPRPEGPLREGARRRDRRSSPASRTRTRSRRTRSCGSTRRAASPPSRRARRARAARGARSSSCRSEGSGSREHASARPHDPVAPRRARGRGDPHHARGRRRARARRCCSSPAARTRSCCSGSPRRRSGPGKFPFPVMHVDTGHNFPEVIEFRDRRVAELGERPDRRVRAGVDRQGPRRRGRPGRARRATSCRRRRCSTRSRSTGSTRRWAARAATRSAPARRSASSASATTSASGTRARSGPSSGTSTTRRIRKGEHIRVFPISNWTELDVWQYVAREKLELPSIYFAHEREVFRRDGMLYAVLRRTSSACRTRSRSSASVRFRTVGDMTLHRRRRVRRARRSTTVVDRDRRDERHRARRDARRRPRHRGRDGGSQACRLLLRHAQQAELLRLVTCGSVDDGKSTLIGRLLYDTKQILVDQLEHIEETSRAARRRLRQPRAAHRRPARRARAGDHDRRRLPLVRHAAPPLPARRRAGPRAVHAQHGHRRLDRRRRRDPASTRARASSSRRGATPTSRRSSRSRTSSSP